MTGAPSPLDVFYRGGRQYIQGSLIISRSAARLAATLPAPEPIFLCDAKFSAIIDQAVDYSISDKPLPAGSGTIHFSTGEQDHFVTIHPADRPAPPRLPDEPSRIVELKERAPLCAEGRYHSLSSFDDAISAVVELNKALHATLPGNVTDIWFASLRSAELPVDGSPFGDSGRIDLDLMVERPWQDRVLTLSRVAVHPDRGASHTFEITYSHRRTG